MENVVNTDKQDIKTMVDRGRYFSIFAPRQSGKTTFLDRIRSQLHNDQTYVIIILSFERYKDLDKKRFYQLLEEVHFNLYAQLLNRLREVNCEKAGKVEQFLNSFQLTDHISFGKLFAELNQIIEYKKIVIFIDENDVEKAVTLLLKEKNSHFDNLYEKAKLYKETFVEIVFNKVEYEPDDEDQGWLEQYGLIRETNGDAVVATNIYKNRYLKTFFKEVKAYREISPQEYLLPGNRLDIERILFNFEQYIAQIGVQAFYKNKKPYEKAGQYLLTAWLYQFVRGGAGELRYEVPSGFGRMDIILTYKGKKYVTETKLNRHNLSRTINEGIARVGSKYQASQSVDEGYLVIFDIKAPVGTESEPQQHQANGKRITSFTIGLQRPDSQSF